MPITGVTSYLPTMDEFIAHWVSANAALTGGGEPVLALKGGYPLANFQTDRAGLDAALLDVEARLNGRELAAAERDQRKLALRSRMSQFRNGVQCYLQATPYEAALPLAPEISSDESKFLSPFLDLSNLWNRINTDTIAGFTAPLLLAGGYTLAQFTTELTAMRTAFVNVTNAEQNLTLSRDERDALLAPIRLRLNQYRSAIPARFDENDPLVSSLPALSPPPGSTPDAVTASGTWDAANEVGVLAWTASTAATLTGYSIRTAPGPTYHTDEETIVGSAPSGTATFSTTAGLTTSGSTALFKVYVLTSTGNEKGSNTVSISRPV